MRLSRALLGALLALALAPAAASAQAEDTIYENLSIPTVDGDRIHVEVARPKGAAKAPVILTYSPYNSLSEGTVAEPRLRRAGAALPAQGLRAGGRRRARDAQLERLLGLRRAQGAAVGRRPRQRAREAAVGERQGRDDRRLLRRHDREHGRRARRRRARAGGDRARARDLALVRLRLCGRRPLPGQLRAADGRGLRHAVRVRLRHRAHAADPAHAADGRRDARPHATRATAPSTR